jgi:hypothetical protein
VEAVYEDLELDYLGGDGETHLRDTSHVIILWRKRYIIFLGRQAASRAPSPPAPPPRAPSLLPPTPSPQAPAPCPSAPSKLRSCQAPPLVRTRATKKAKVQDQPLAENKEDLDAYVVGEVKRQFKPRSLEKKIPIDPSVKYFFKKMSTTNKEVLKITDYERTLKKAYYKMSKPVPQLGEQPNQEIEPLVTGQEIGIKEFISDTVLARDQLLKGAPIPTAEMKYQFELGKPLVKPEQLKSLSTQMYRFHERYMEMSANGKQMFGARIRNSDFFQGEDVLWILFEDVFDLYYLDAHDVSLLSTWILMLI